MPSAPARFCFNFRFILHDEMFDQTVESELENLSGEYETAAEGTRGDRRTACAICDITHTK